MSKLEIAKKGNIFISGFDGSGYLKKILFNLIEEKRNNIVVLDEGKNGNFLNEIKSLLKFENFEPVSNFGIFVNGEYETWLVKFENETFFGKGVENCNFVYCSNKKYFGHLNSYFISKKNSIIFTNASYQGFFNTASEQGFQEKESELSKNLIINKEQKDEIIKNLDKLKNCILYGSPTNFNLINGKITHLINSIKK